MHHNLSSKSLQIFKIACYPCSFVDQLLIFLKIRNFFGKWTKKCKCWELSQRPIWFWFCCRIFTKYLFINNMVQEPLRDLFLISLFPSFHAFFPPSHCFLSISNSGLWITCKRIAFFPYLQFDSHSFLPGSSCESGVFIAILHTCTWRQFLSRSTLVKEYMWAIHLISREQRVSFLSSIFCYKNISKIYYITFQTEDEDLTLDPGFS